MNRVVLGLFLLLLSVLSVGAQNLTKSVAEDFINKWLRNSDELLNYIDSTELSLSNRLGINYSGVKFKSLISLLPEEKIKNEILSHKLDYKYSIDYLGDGYSILNIQILKKNLSYDLIFHNSKMISKPLYYSRYRQKTTSKYFVFYISDLQSINNYSIAKLDSFVDSVLVLLKCNTAEKEKLQKEKINYFLCSDNEEIKQLTGYSARGMYYLADDFIISTFNSHYHEVAHLLINYKIKSNKLYTIPFLQEGFAVAFGGRGGRDADVILNLGSFISQSDFLDYKMLLSKNDFYQFDASMTYPLSGLYVKFLIEQKGIEYFIKLYKQYSSSDNSINDQKVKLNDLPSEETWHDYLEKQIPGNKINISEINPNQYPEEIINNKDFRIYGNDQEYLLMIKYSIGIKTKYEPLNYHSKLFNELFPGQAYKSEKYVVTADSNEVSIYNLFTNNLIAKYTRGFSLNNLPVRQINGYYIFSINKNLFDESLKDLKFEVIN